MAEPSVANGGPTRGRDSTRSITANEQNVAQMACVLLVDVEPVREALLGEPLAEALSMVMWSLAHEEDEGFDAAIALPAWAAKRERGAWRPEPSSAERTWSGNSPEQDREIERSLENGGRSRPAGKWGRLTNEQVRANLDRMERS